MYNKDMEELIKLILKLIKLFTKPKGVLLPTSTVEVGSMELRSILSSKFPNAQLFMSDRKYKLCSVVDIKAFLKQNNTDKMKYKEDYLDCDDFSYRLMGQFSIPEWSSLAFGIMWTNKHALNCLVDSGRNFYFIEPQNDKIQEKLEPWQGSTIRFVLM